MGKNTKYILLGGLALVVVLFIVYAVQPGQYDAFATCLEEQNVTFYGSFTCPHCAEQKRLFGKSESKLPYVECTPQNGQGQLPVCEEAGIMNYPTWEFADGSRETGVLSLEQLSEQSGCSLDGEFTGAPATGDSPEDVPPTDSISDVPEAPTGSPALPDEDDADGEPADDAADSVEGAEELEVEAEATQSGDLEVQ